ncbi:MAG TPA: hypothetical protein VJS17_09580, partial [Pyrinomonadaceae bacterium]|nr:hypothetical protein [Pyrinomonadaceae bacterium]
SAVGFSSAGTKRSAMAIGTNISSQSSLGLSHFRDLECVALDPAVAGMKDYLTHRYKQAKARI